MRSQVVKAFLKEEPGRTYQYQYRVEDMNGGQKIFLQRPTRKNSCDFKVVVEGITIKGTHEEIFEDLRLKQSEDADAFRSLMQAIRKVHSGRDVDAVISEHPLKLKRGLSVELVLKLLKWYFILEDVNYWRYDGRDTLMNALEAAVNQTRLG
jgi:hypothetical protein